MDTNNIKKVYSKLNYFDQYGASFLLFIIITIALFIIISYCFTMINIQPILDDWGNQRCKINIIPFAGYISKHDGVSNEDYNYQNFVYCTQNILSSITGAMVEPITFITKSFGTVTDDIKNAINDIRAMFDKIRTFFQTMTQELMGRILNMTIPLQQIVISMRDVIGKMQGTMTAGLFTLLGAFYALQSLMGAIAEFIIIILITLAAMIAVFWIFPFTWGMAISFTGIFIAIVIPMAIILAFMLDVLGVKPDLSIPKLKCFDENTPILMKNGKYKTINDIHLGDVLSENNYVTAIIKVTTIGSKMYDLDGIIVSNSHIVYLPESDKWIPVSIHPRATPLCNYNKPYLYCLNTSNKTITVNNYLFTDWDEIYGETLTKVKNNPFIKINNNNDIHKFLDGGFSQDTKIKLLIGEERNICDIRIGDILENNSVVYGVVEIDGTDILQYNYEFLNTSFQGGPNLAIYEKKNKQTIHTTLEFNKNKHIHKTQSQKLYHLLTNSKTFQVGNIQFQDYNGCIDFINS